MPPELDIVEDLPPLPAEPSTHPAGEIMLSIGSVSLSVSATSYARLKRSSAWRWPAQNPIGHAPHLQWLGPGRDTIAVDGVLYPAHRPGGGALEALRALAATGAGHLLVGGDGAVHGRWAVLKLDETAESFFADGRARKIKWSLSLEYGGDDLPQGEETALTSRSDPDASPKVQVDAAVAAFDAGDTGPEIAARVQAAVADASTLTPAQQAAIDAAQSVVIDAGSASAVLDAVEASAALLPGAESTAPAPVEAAWRASAGQSLADIAYRRYGTSEAVSELLRANRRWQLTPRLAAGDLVALPARRSVDPPRDVADLVTLWS